MKSSSGGLAVVTGAAGGLGAAFARQLAARGHRLLLVDRRQGQVERICEELSSRFGVDAEAYAIDLCDRDEVLQLAEKLRRTPDMELLVNNAGFGTMEYFVDCDLKHILGMLDVHSVTPAILTHAVLPGMLERNHGAIINVSSLSSWFLHAGNVQYAATKSYLANFSIALADELRGTKVRVQALCPGFVRTDFHAAETMQNFDPKEVPSSSLWMSADDVVRCSLDRLSGKQVIVTPGFLYALVGRLAKMPLLQPIIWWFGRRPRRTSTKPTVETALSTAPNIADARTAPREPAISSREQT